VDILYAIPGKKDAKVQGMFQLICNSNHVIFTINHYSEKHNIIVALSFRKSEPPTALSLLERLRDRQVVTTLCRGLNEMLGGGVACGEITEFCEFFVF
jgi:hypothetical protein